MPDASSVWVPLGLFRAFGYIPSHVKRRAASEAGAEASCVGRNKREELEKG